MADYKKYSNEIYAIIGAAMNVHNELHWGLLEPVYQEALQVELGSRGIKSEREKEILVYYKGMPLEKRYKMDMLVDDIIIELKSVTSINPAHRAQLCNYLRLTRKPVGLLINFGEEQLVGERWVYDEETNRCYIVDRMMNPIDDVDYDEILT